MTTTWSSCQTYEEFREVVRSAPDAFEVAVEALKTFVGANFTGHIERLEESKQYVPSFLLSEPLNTKVVEDLSLNFNSPHPSARGLHYLWLAKEILCTGDTSHFETTFDHLLWRFRTLRVWSLVLREPSVTLKTSMDETIAKMTALLKDPDAQQPSSRDLLQWLLERVGFHLAHFESEPAREALELAARIVGVEVELIGALGRRTRFQQTSIAQLVLTTKSEPTKDAATPVEQAPDATLDLPVNCRNTDDTLLERVRLDDDSLGAVEGALSDEQLAYVLVLGLYERRTTYADELQKEKLRSFIDKITTESLNWAVQTRALVERSSLEKAHGRMVERACSQMEAISKLLDALDDETPSARKSDRLRLLLATCPMPHWQVKAEHAEILISLGCVSEALQIFESLQAWSEVVACYKRLNQLEKAESLVRQLLEKQETPEYLCLLGDITSNAEYYEKAVKISDDRSARARAAIGDLMLRRKRYEDAFVNYKRSLELQPFQLRVSFNMGHCAFQLAKFQDAATAYHRCVTFEPEHFEAWNNLAAAYVHLDQKPRAQKVLQEALKLNFEHRQMWENYLLLSTEVRDFEQAVAAAQRYLDMDRKHKVDELVLEVLLSEVQDMPAEQEGTQRLRKSLTEVMARVLARQSVNGKVLRLYAHLKKPTDDSVEAWTQFTDLLEKAARRDASSAKEEQSQEAASIRSLQNALELVDALRHLWRLRGMTDDEISAQVALRLRPTLSAVEQTYGRGCTGTDNEALREAYDAAASKLLTQ